MIIFRSVKAGSNFAIFNDSRNKFFGFGDCEHGELLSSKSGSVKKLKTLVMKHKRNRLFAEKLFVGKNNCILVDSMKFIFFNQIIAKRKIYGWGKTGAGELGVDFLKEDFISSLGNISIASILTNADTDKLIVNVKK